MKKGVVIFILIWIILTGINFINAAQNSKYPNVGICSDANWNIGKPDGNTCTGIKRVYEASLSKIECKKGSELLKPTLANLNKLCQVFTGEADSYAYKASVHGCCNNYCSGNYWDNNRNKWICAINVPAGGESVGKWIDCGTDCCAPQCSGKQCGSNGCGGSCGTCSGATTKCDLNGNCVECLINDDCNEGKICSNGDCVSPEDPCASKNCNDNAPCTEDSCSNGNCVNTLISCPNGQTCDNGVCIILIINGNVSWQNMNGEEILSAEIGDSVKMVLNRSDISNKNIDYTIYKKDTFLWFFKFNKQIAQFSSIGFAIWKTNETGEFYFNASVEDFPEIYSSSILNVGDREDNARPSIAIVKPIENSTFIIKADGYTDDINFEQNASDEDDLIDVYWNFNDGNMAVFNNCNNGVNNCNAIHRYSSAFAGTRIINATAKEAIRNQLEYDLSRIYVYKEGLVLFMIIDKPNYKLREFPQTPITLDARSTHVANCSRSLDICRASAAGKTCSEITDGVNPADKLYCYVYAPSSSNKFKFRWIVDGTTRPSFPTNSSLFEISFPQGGKHDIELNARFTI